MCGQDGFGAQAELAVAVDGDGGVVDSGPLVAGAPSIAALGRCDTGGICRFGGGEPIDAVEHSHRG
jgi:hypothetical protein